MSCTYFAWISNRQRFWRGHEHYTTRYFLIGFHRDYKPPFNLSILFWLRCLQVSGPHGRNTEGHCILYNFSFHAILFTHYPYDDTINIIFIAYNNIITDAIVIVITIIIISDDQLCKGQVQLPLVIHLYSYCTHIYKIILYERTCPEWPTDSSSLNPDHRCYECENLSVVLFYDSQRLIIRKDFFKIWYFIYVLKREFWDSRWKSGTNPMHSNRHVYVASIKKTIHFETKCVFVALIHSKLLISKCWHRDCFQRYQESLVDK